MMNNVLQRLVHQKDKSNTHLHDEIQVLATQHSLLKNEEKKEKEKRKPQIEQHPSFTPTSKDSKQ